jgi:benzoyl-CoA 2,3-dioxygenase component B
MTAIDYNERIPNNVNLAADRRLLRALEAWRPAYLQWWRELGPEGAESIEVYLRTAINADSSGWAQFDYVRMPDYRWGIFLAERDRERRINFGDFKGEPAWQEVPGEVRGTLRRLIVTQGDTEPASVEQQRLLGRTAPSLYDLRNLFQVNVEEGRHLWAMVYLLHAYFGRDGREEADEMLRRHSGDPDKPRILGAFNEATPDWLSYFMFTFFTDRDGKYQLASLAESGFDPLARSCRFMLTEEAHHMFVGESGVARIIERACQIMRAERTDDVRARGAIDLATVQRYLNFHFSVSLDLFGRELSSNSANYYAQGLKGRYGETKIADDHKLADAAYRVPKLDDGRIVTVEAPALSALNERLREDYITDCQRGIDRWNRVTEKYAIPVKLALPHRAFHRAIGAFAAVKVAPDGRVVSAAEWQSCSGDWLPTEADRAFIQALMGGAVIEPGRMASWIAPPAKGIDDRPGDFQYVRFN